METTVIDLVTMNYTLTTNTTAVNINTSTPSQNHSDLLDVQEFVEFEYYVRIIIPIIFGLIVALGLLGNLLVIVVILMNQQMRSTTNILILNLAIADLCFIIFCVPFTGTGYVLPQWPFGRIWCKIVQFLIYVCAYASVYTLVMMSLDRYLAVVHPIYSMSYRTQRNTVWILLCLWGLILGGHTPLLFHNDVIHYVYNGDPRSACVNKVTVNNNSAAKLFYGSFFACGYVLPLSLIVVLYGFMLKRLLYGVVPGGSQRAESIRSKKRVTKMVVIVVVIFALCWLPIQIVFIIQNFGNFDEGVHSIAIQMVSNCLAYMNSCVNPILYAFLSDNFRRSFKKVLCCGYGHYTKFEYERTNIKIEKTEKTTVAQQPSNNGTTMTPASTGVSTTTLQTYYHNADSNRDTANHCTQTEV
ncbi:allatostatin-A receptor-like [Mya arenaria]|uniref:allatostatin-A receptor-like n=1 Tax=Mya arenaria TaxID=6604 RepID=UPI0022E7BF04|nr:allatostatin-A receptor-like [Mya arenaria]